MTDKSNLYNKTEKWKEFPFSFKDLEVIPKDISLAMGYSDENIDTVVQAALLRLT